MEHREFTRRYIGFIEKWMKVSCIGILAILLIIVVTNLIW
jgi:hypothetical protein